MPGPLAYAGVAAGSALLNMLAGNAAGDRQNKLRAELMRLFSTSNLQNETDSAFKVMQSSPMYSALRNRAMSSSAGLANQLQSSFARAGLSRSGIAATALPIAKASHIGKFQDIDMEMFTQALQQARQLISQRAAVLQGTSGPSGMEMGIGNTLQSIMPMLLAMLSKQGTGGGQSGYGNGPRMGEPGFTWK